MNPNDVLGESSDVAVDPTNERQKGKKARRKEKRNVSFGRETHVDVGCRARKKKRKKKEEGEGERERERESKREREESATV